MLFRELDKIKLSAVMAAIVLMFIGISLIILPESYMPFLWDTLGFVFLVAFLLAVMHFIGSRRAMIHYVILGLGLICGLAGMMVFLFDDLMMRLLYILMGAVPILGGLYGLFHAFVFARRSGRRGWQTLIVLALLAILFGVLTFMNPWTKMPDKQMRLIGGALMYTALISALSLIWLWPVRKADKENTK